jgi:hypothetical protein
MDPSMQAPYEVNILGELPDWKEVLRQCRGRKLKLSRIEANSAGQKKRVVTWKSAWR